MLLLRHDIRRLPLDADDDTLPPRDEAILMREVSPAASATRRPAMNDVVRYIYER